jgi:hypothetical protein
VDFPLRHRFAMTPPPSATGEDKKSRLPGGKAAVGMPLRHGSCMGCDSTASPVELLYRRSPLVQSKSVTGSPPSRRVCPSRRGLTCPPPGFCSPGRRSGHIARCASGAGHRSSRVPVGAGRGSHALARGEVPRWFHYVFTGAGCKSDAGVVEFFGWGERDQGLGIGDWGRGEGEEADCKSAPLGEWGGGTIPHESRNHARRTEPTAQGP